LGVTKHIAAPRLGARAAATSYNPVRYMQFLLAGIVFNRIKKYKFKGD